MSKKKVLDACAELLKGELDLPENAGVRERIIPAIATLGHGEVTKEVYELFSHFADKYHYPGVEAQWIATVLGCARSTGDKGVGFSLAAGELAVILNPTPDNE